MKWQERIVVDPEIMAGKPVVKDARLTDSLAAEHDQIVQDLDVSISMRVERS